MTVRKVGTIVAGAGEVARGRLEAGTMADGTPLAVPVILIHGARGDGPTVYVQAAVHGVEYNPLEALRQALAAISPADLRGTLIAVPVANPMGVNLRVRQHPFDMVDLNRVYPGREDGSLTDRLLHTVYSNAIRQSDYVVDLHTTDGTTLPHIRMGQSQAEHDLARIFGLEHLVDERIDEVLRRARYDGKLRLVAMADGKPAITPELGGHRRIQPAVADQGRRGILNVLKYLSMLEGEVELPPEQTVVSYDSGSFLRTNHGGLFIAAVSFGSKVTRGELIGRLYDMGTFAEIEEYRSPFDGLLVSHSEQPALHAGDSVAMVARIERTLYNSQP